MKVLLQVFLLTILCVRVSHAANYYFSSVSGDDNRSTQQVQNALTPWRTLDKFNSISGSLKPGDSVFFKRGEVFYGSMAVLSSGVSGNPIYYGAFGVGSNPVISGFTLLSDWTIYKTGIYSVPLDMPNLQMVTINGEAKGMGRYPNTGYLKYENSSGNSSITDNELPASPNWTGGEIVMRKFRFILDRHPIVNHAGTTLVYDTSTINGNNSAYKPVNGNGYFLQNHMQTLDQFGEWYYDKTDKRLYVFFGSNLPANVIVKASTLSFNVTASTVSYLLFENLNFEGANRVGMNLVNVANTTVKNCNFYNQGGTSIYGIDLNAVAITGGSINTSFSNGINFEYNDNNCTIDGVSVNKSNTIAGTGRSGDGASIGIAVAGNNATIKNNQVIQCGYNGIQFIGGNITVENNYVDTFCTLKDDGGGIYTYNADATVYAAGNRKIRNNIVLNAIGAFAGSETYWWENFGKAAGIYLDQGSNGIDISGNVIANGDWGGLFLHKSYRNTITNNLIYNHRYQVHVTQDQTVTRNNTMTDNQYIAKQASQNTFYYRTYISDSPSAMGTFDRNYYARLMDDNATILIENNWTGGSGSSVMSLQNWKTAYNLDASSKKSPLTYTSNIDNNVRFEYNNTKAVKVVHLTASYLDVKGNQYAGDFALEPFTGVVLLKSASSFTPNQVITFPAIADKTYGDAPFTLNATSTSGLNIKFRVISGPANVSNTDKVTLTGPGTVTIEATQDGNKNYKAATPVRQSFYVWPPKSQTITFAAIPGKKYGDAPFALNATASSGLPVSFQVISGMATVSGNMLTINSASITTIIVEATQAGNSTYKPAAPVRQRFTVSKLNQAINFPQPADKYYGDAPFAINATASSGLPVTFKVSSGNATISGNVVTITGTGSVWIAASAAGNENYEWAPSVSQGFWVSKGAQTITFPAIPNKMVGDAPFALNATASSGLPVSYRVLSGPATVDGNTVTVTGTGEVWIGASQDGNENYNLASSVGQNFLVTGPTSPGSTTSASTKVQESNAARAASDERLQLSVFPNPMRKQGFVRVQVPAATGGFLNIYDRAGKLVKQLGYRYFEKGMPYNIDLNVQGLPGGIYFIRFSSVKSIESKMFQKL